MTTPETPRMTADECFESLTGFDEIAIEKAFGHDVMTLVDTKQLTFSRALVFILRRRAGLKDAEAKADVMAMAVGDVLATFDDDDEADPEDPVTAAGKDAAPPA